MWDKAHLLRIAGNTLFAISFVLLAYGGLRYVLQLPVFNLRSVQLTSVPQHVDVDLVNKVVRSSVRGSFFSVDLEQTRRAFEQLPWVRKVSVRRKFPWSLEVSLEEHVALARWNGDGELVNTHGEVFTAQSSEALPMLAGQPDTSQQVAEMYADLGQQLSGIGHIAQLSLSPRFAWQVRMDNGLVLDLGREQVMQRVARFVQVYPYSLAASASALNRVDLRYRNGFAVSLGARATTQKAGTGSQRVRL
ncbi:MAG TPA: cell division protein FtsQ/DivIB [Gallionellaceae bacterium]